MKFTQTLSKSMSLRYVLNWVKCIHLLYVLQLGVASVDDQMYIMIQASQLRENYFILKQNNSFPIQWTCMLSFQ